MNAVSKAFQDAGSDEDDYARDAFEEAEGRVAATKAALSGKSALQQAAAQAAAESRVDAQKAMKNEYGHMEFEAEAEAEVGHRGGSNARGNGGAPESLARDNESEEEEEDEDEDDASSTALRVACWHGEPKKVAKLLDDGASPRARDRHGWNALHWAAKSGDSECMQLLVEAVERVRGKGKGKGKGKGGAAFYLNCMDTLCGWTPLHVACINARKDAVKVLLTLGADKSKRNFMKELPVECVPASARNARHIKRLLGVVEQEQGQESEGKDQDEEKEKERDRDGDRDRGGDRGTGRGGERGREEKAASREEKSRSE